MGLFSSKKKTKTQATFQTEESPYAPTIPYVTSGLSEGQKLYEQNKILTPDEEAARQAQVSVLKTRQADPFLGQTKGVASDIMSGAYSPDIQRIGSVRTGRDIRTPLVGAERTEAASMEGVGPLGSRNVRSGVINATSTNGTAARAGQGALDPTATLASLLDINSGNPQLDAMADAVNRKGKRDFADMTQDADENLTRSVLPAVRSGAVLGGGYGGSRQGIAEGLAIAQREKDLSRAARDVSIAGEDAGANLRGQSYERARDRQLTAADNLDARGLEMAEANARRGQEASVLNVGNRLTADTGNANRSLDASKATAQNTLDTQRTNSGYVQSTRAANADRQVGVDTDNANRTVDVGKYNRDFALDVGKTNADIAGRNNDQELARAGLVPSILKTGTDLYKGATGAEDNDFSSLMSVLGLPRTMSQEAFSNLMGPLLQAAGLGGTKTGSSSGTTTEKQGLNLLGELFKVLQSGAEGAGKAAAAGSDARIKRDVVPSYYDMAGRRWVEFSYLWDEPGVRHLGVIAQEVMKTDPEAVSVHPLGFYVVDYAMLGAPMVTFKIAEAA